MADGERRFALALRGYDRNQVDEYARRTQGLLAEAERRVRAVESRPSPAQCEAEELLLRARCRAEAQANSITAAAEAAARQLLTDAERSARSRVDAAEVRRRQLEQETAILAERYRALEADLARLRRWAG